MEDSFFYETLTPRQVNGVMKSLQPGWDCGEFARLLEAYQLPEKKLIKDMSKGMRMKFRLATALAHKPRLLILDEATSSINRWCAARCWTTCWTTCGTTSRTKTTAF